MAKFRSLGIIGTGNMGGALLRGVVKSGLLDAGSIIIYDANSTLVYSLVKELGVTPAQTSQEVASVSDWIVSCVKPQIFPEIAGGLKALPGSKVLISIMAGLKSGSIKKILSDDWTVVRTMPNLPLSVSQGATAIEIDGLDETILLGVEELFSVVGSTVRVSGSQLDAVTGLSGSGPMYVFEFADGLIKAGIESGLEPDVSRSLVLQTIRGALSLLESGKDTPEEWVQKVCSPGGTTLKGLEQLKEGSFKETLGKAVSAAVARSVELGNT